MVTNQSKLVIDAESGQVIEHGNSPVVRRSPGSAIIAAGVAVVGGAKVMMMQAMAQTNIATLIEEAESTWGSIFPIMCAITLGGIGIAFVKRFKRS